MSPELLNLHISQLSKTFDKSKTNWYADNRKRAYHDKLIKIFEHIQGIKLYELSYERQKNLKLVLDFIFLSIEFLDNSTLTNIPYEIVYCLDNALSDWANPDEYIIVTSLQNNLDSYRLNGILALSTLYYDIIKSMFGIEFEFKLIQIHMPKYLVHDYLANVVLYHELGHFVDFKYKISEKLTNSLIANGIIDSSNKTVFHNHAKEFFSDIFASQYIGKSSNYYLNYIAHNHPDIPSHPSTESRIKMVSDFLNNKITPELHNLLLATELSTKKKLEIRHNKIEQNDFKNFIPPVLKDIQRLHSIFEVGWDLWLTNVKEYEMKNIDSKNKYRIINNLIEKSISNYMILQSWNKCS